MASSTMKIDKIDVHLAEAKTSLPEALTARLSGSPTKSPDELRAISERSASLRRLHLENIKERANVASSRANEANLRRLRLAAASSERILKKTTAQETKVGAKKEAAEAERLLKKEKREEAQRNVREARTMAEKARSARFAELALAETIAHQKWSKTIAETKSKSAAQVQHALAVAAAHKEKAVLDAAAIGEKLGLKLAAAETRRELAAASPATAALSIAAGDASALAASTGPPSPKGAKATLHRVLNDTKVHAQTKAKLLEASMAKAVEKRAAHLASVQAKAEKTCAKAAAVVAKSKAVSEGTDKEVAEAKAALYDKLVRAESARLFALKAKYGALHASAPTAAASLLVVDLSDVITTPRKPPPALSLRLSSCGRGLRAPAAPRQAGAAARRLGAKHAKCAKLAAAVERRAAAAARYGRAAAAKGAEVDAKAERALINKAIADGARKFAVVSQRAKATAAALKRDASDAATKAAGAAKRVQAAAAAERKGAKLRGIAKAGVLSVRLAANASRKAAALECKRTRAAALEVRAVAAAAKRAEILAARVQLAKKRMVAPHPKREVADAEVKAAFSDA